jgi:hypothetical protein
MKNKLKFGKGNAKLNTAIAIMDLPAGWSCPQADQCLSRANRLTGKITDGKNTQWRCYAASSEGPFPSVRKKRWHNFDLLKKASTIENMANLIQASLPSNTTYIRVHSSGDFFNERYFLAWLNVALNNPLLVFYGYSKCLNFFVKYKKQIPSNFRFTASYGGKLDAFISKHKMIYAKVVFSVKEASDLKLEIDHDDSHSIAFKSPYLLLIHNTQPAGTPAAAAVQKLRKLGIGGYGRNNKSDKHNKTVKIYVNLDSVKDTISKTIQTVPVMSVPSTNSFPHNQTFHMRKKRHLVPS